MENNYSYSKKVSMDFDDAIAKTREALQSEGFGILTEIDVKDTLKKKLNVDYDNYLILGACNPPFAYKALQIEKEIGILLPCNVIIYSDNNDITVSAVNPVQAMSFIDNPELKKIAEEVGNKLKKVIDKI